MRKTFAVDRGAGISKSRDQLRQKLLEIHRFADICKSGFAQRRSKVTKKKRWYFTENSLKKIYEEYEKNSVFLYRKNCVKKNCG